MAKSLMLRHSNKKRNKTKQKTVSCRVKESKLAFSFFVVLLVCVMGFAYVSKINNAATKGYEIENYEKRLSELEKEKQSMLVKLADLKSIQALDSENDNLAVINYKDIAYITSTSGAVAMK